MINGIQNNMFKGLDFDITVLQITYMNQLLHRIGKMLPTGSIY